MNWFLYTLLLWLSLLNVFPEVISTNITCFTCNSVAHPSQCTRVVQCSPHEVCSTEKQITPDGHATYYTGCRNTLRCRSSGRRSVGITTCTECCNTDFCNTGGCGEPALPSPDQRGPVCFNCDAAYADGYCNQVTICGRDQLCNIMKVPDTRFNGHVYKSGCVSITACSATLVGRRDILYGFKRSGSFCFHCCSGDFCNRHCTSTASPTTATTI